MPSGRRPSTSSDPESSSDSGRSSPLLSALDSSSALILVHDDEENDIPFNFPEEDNDNDNDFDEIGRIYVQPLAPSAVFLYLLAPYLKLGAMLLPNTLLPLKFGLPALLLFAILSAFVRQIWYMLARYLRKSDLEDVIVDVFARSRRGTQRRRQLLRGLVRAGTGGLRVMLATIYLRESVHALLPSLSGTFGPRSGPILAIVLGFALLLFYSAQSLASRRIIWVSWLSIATFIAWFGCVTYAHTKGTLKVNPGWLRMGSLWQGITTTAFTLTSSPTLPLYASLKAGIPNVTTVKTSPARSFRLLSIISAFVAVALTIPLAFFAAAPNVLATQDAPPSSRIEPYISFSHAATLLLGIPAILVTIPPLPIPDRIRRSTTIPVSRLLILLAIVILSLVPTQVSSVLSDILLSCALTGTYFLPALVHITAHFFRRPLTIVIPALPSVAPTPNPPSTSSFDSPLSSAQDELLQRKERALQRRQLRKRIVWDIGVWTLLLPVGGGGLVWAVGSLAGKW